MTAYHTDSYSRSSPVCDGERVRMDLQFQRNTAIAFHQALTTVHPREVLRMADFGSGYGASAGALAERGVPARLHYVDVNPVLLDMAKQRALSAGLPVEPVLGALDRPGPYRFGADLSLASFVLEHCADLAQSMATLAASVRVGGMVVVSDVDYHASATHGDDAARETLALLRDRLPIKDLAGSIDAVAADHGLRPHGEFACLDWIEVDSARGAVKNKALDFVGNFAPDDPAHIAWKRIGDGAAMYTRRLRRVYCRVI